MRHLIVSSPTDSVEQVRSLAEKHQAKHLFQFPVQSNGQERVTSSLCLQNGQVGKFLDELEQDETFDADITLFPFPVVTLHSPFGQAPTDVTDTQMRSPFEVFQEGIQAVGAVKGLVGYSVLAGVIVWVGLYTNSVSLLVASMLVAPFAGPAMNLALSSSRGDLKLLGQSLARYVRAIVTTVSTCFLLSLVMGQGHSTEQMVFSAKLSSVSILLPLAAGAAGALNLIQSQRDSLVSGAAVGVMVAAALAPPAGTLGMALALGQGAMIKNTTFLIILQLLAINLAGALIFRWHGLTPTQGLFERGKQAVFYAAVSVSLFALVGMVVAQRAEKPNLQRSTVQQSIADRTRAYLREREGLRTLRVQVTFLESSEDSGYPVRVEIEAVELNDEVQKDFLETDLTSLLKEEFAQIEPFVTIRTFSMVRDNLSAKEFSSQTPDP